MPSLKTKLTLVACLALAALAASCGSAGFEPATIQPGEPLATAQDGLPAAPVLYRNAAEWVLAKNLYGLLLGRTDADDDFQGITIDEQGSWDALHQEMQTGPNELNPRMALAHSGNVAPESFFDGLKLGSGNVLYPTYVDGLKLVSSEHKLSFVTYGLKDFPGQQKALSLSVDAIAGPEGEAAQQGLFVGIGNFKTETWQWYGPFSTAELQDIDIRGTYSVNAQDRSYITLLCAGGDSYGIRGLTVEVGNLN